MVLNETVGEIALARLAIRLDSLHSEMLGWEEIKPQIRGVAHEISQQMGLPYTEAYTGLLELVNECFQSNVSDGVVLTETLVAATSLRK